MPNLEILMRTDLKMRTGKMVAQAGHAAMMVVISRLRGRGEDLVMSAADVKLLRAFIKNPDVRADLVFGQNDLTERPLADANFHLIIDNGATEFHGVKTMTCGAGGIFARDPAPEPICTPDSGAPANARQYFIVSREDAPLKSTSLEMAAIGCITELEKLIVYVPDGSGDCVIERSANPAFFEWISNGYPKIGLQVPVHDDLVVLQSKLKDAGVQSTMVWHYGCSMLVTSPAYSDTIAPVTSGLKLM